MRQDRESVFSLLNNSSPFTNFCGGNARSGDIAHRYISNPFFPLDQFVTLFALLPKSDLAVIMEPAVT